MIFNLNTLTQIMTLPCNKGHRRLFFQCWWQGGTASLHWAIMHGWWAQHYRETVTHDISSLMLAEHGGHFIILYDHREQATLWYTLLTLLRLCPHQRFVATLPSAPVLIFINQTNQNCPFFKPIWYLQALQANIYRRFCIYIENIYRGFIIL